MILSNVDQDKLIVLFDGVCNLCNQSVQFIVQRDANDVFRFTSLQSEKGKELLHYLGVASQKLDSIILYEPHKAYYNKAEAVKYIIKNMSVWYSFLHVLIPTGKIGNLLYDFIASHRYQWFGKQDNCMVPTEDILKKFL